MAATIFKPLKKKGDGRLGELNRQDSVLASAKNSSPKGPKYQNSYRLEPFKSFNVETVDKIVKQVMINNLEDIVYDAKECPKICAEISADIRNRIRKQNFDRHRKPGSNTERALSLGRPISLQSKLGMSTISLIPGHTAMSAIFRNTKGGYKVPRYQNSYRLSSHNPYKQEVVDKILEDVMTTTLTGMKYHPEVCMKLCQDMTAEIRNKIYRKDFDRYKCIVQVTIIEKTGQSVQISNGRLWDVERDSYSTFTFESPQMYAAGIVIGVYFE